MGERRLQEDGEGDGKERRETSFIKSNTVRKVPMVIKWSDCVNIREPWRKGHSICAAGGADGRSSGMCPPGRLLTPEVDGTEAREGARRRSVVRSSTRSRVSS